MHLNPDDLRRHYASLSDEALKEIDRSELVEIAQQCYDEERARRGWPGAVRIKIDGEPPPPDWIQEAACVCTYDVLLDAPADEACETLRRAGIPAYMSTEKIQAQWVRDYFKYRVMVPGNLELEATSVLDRDMVNPELARSWKDHLETLTDEEFRAVKFEAVLAGLLDRVERLKRVYNEEVERRNSPAED